MAFRALSGLRQLRFILCNQCPSSDGVRNFLVKHYESIGSSSTPIIVRESHSADPYLIASYRFGVQRKVDLKNLSVAQIQQKLKQVQQKSREMNADEPAK